MSKESGLCNPEVTTAACSPVRWENGGLESVGESGGGAISSDYLAFLRPFEVPGCEKRRLARPAGEGAININSTACPAGERHGGDWG